MKLLSLVIVVLLSFPAFAATPCFPDGSETPESFKCIEDKVEQLQAELARQLQSLKGKIRIKSKGNNGTVCCSTYCAEEKFDNWTGTCVGACIFEGPNVGKYASCEKATGVPNSLNCWCSTFDD
jgi:hypothetical protein